MREDHFLAAEESISWAVDGALELRGEIRAFFADNPPKSVVEVDPITQDNVEKIRLTANIPHSFRRKATESLNNARHGFDQIVFAAVNALSGPSTKGVNYPWAQTPTDVERLMEKRGIDLRLLPTILKHEPYPTSDQHVGGDDRIRSLAIVANNKHSVGLTVGATFTSINESMSVSPGIHKIAVMHPIWDAKKQEVELVRWQGVGRVETHYRTMFTVCLKDRNLPDGVDVVSALHTFATKARHVLDDVRNECARILQTEPEGG